MKSTIKSAEEMLDGLCAVLMQEIQLLDLLAERERALQGHLLDRDWHGLQLIIDEMTTLSEQIQIAERSRSHHFAALRLSMGLGESAGFSELIARLDAAATDRLRALYRGLKISVMRIRSLTGGIDAYVASSTATMRSFLEESSPDHRGTIYGRDGAAGNAGTRALVVDRQL